jgi:hypothetical protein
MLDDSILNYLNMAELKQFCKQHHIPYHITVEMPNGAIKQGPTDRKGIILKHIRRYLKTGKLPKGTLFKKTVVSFEKLPVTLTAHDRVYYGQYKHKHEKIAKIMNQLTERKFKFGAIAQQVLHSHWSRGNAPTFQEFSSLWLKAQKAHQRPNAEWAFLTDLSQGVSMQDWKKLRQQKAKVALEMLSKHFQSEKIK